jgi:hypothetical protein
MDDLKTRLRTARDDDHERGCQMRFVLCSCGYDDATAKAVGDALTRIEALEAENAAMTRIIYHYVDPGETRQDDEAFVLAIARTEALKGPTDDD